MAPKIGRLIGGLSRGYNKIYTCQKRTGNHGSGLDPNGLYARDLVRSHNLVIDERKKDWVVLLIFMLNPAIL